MADTINESLAAHLRSMSIDNFSIAGSTVRIGRTHWSASVCRCGDPACDGWSLEPLPAAPIQIAAAAPAVRRAG
jgi:hypothetical protein